jgi:UDP-N-acetylglucosamine 2-epimerase (non-hydrolysing)
MIDSLVAHKDKAKESRILEELNVSKDDFILMTMHRPANVDTDAGLRTILEILDLVGHETPVVFPMHPRTHNNLIKYGLMDKLDDVEHLIITEPLGYLDFLKLEMSSKLVITDSGGLQEETTYFGVPCLTLRENTERPITISQGTNMLLPVDPGSVLAEVEKINRGSWKKGMIPEKWDGKTAERTCTVIHNWFQARG